jgi:hypothetical protein
MTKYIVKIGEQIIKECESYLEAEAHAEFLINMGDESMIEIEEVEG